MSKGWKITTIIISSLLAVIFIFLGVYYLWPWNKSFFDMSSEEFEIPGLDSKFTPQGMTSIDGSEKYLICGYMSDNSPSRFYVINEGKVEKYFTLTQSGVDYTGHAGGVVSKGSTFWVVGDKKCFRFSLNDINKCEDGGSVTILDSFVTDNGADFVFENNGILWIGEFFREGKYETESNHKLVTTSGETNTAIVFGYQIDESKGYGLQSQAPIPCKALSIRGLVQGIDVTKDGKFVVSTSYGLSDSNIYIYDNVFSGERDDVFEYDKVQLDLWYLDNNSLLKTINAPAMSEELVIKNDRVYVLFESGAKKYKIFNRKQLKNVYSFALSSVLTN